MNFGDPLFIIGNPRSGTTMLRLMLACHSEVLIPPECGFIIWLKEKFSSWQRQDSHLCEKRSSFIEELFASKKFDTWKLEKNTVEEQIVFHQPATYADLCSVVYASYGLSIEKRFSMWGDKNNFHINHMDCLLELYPNARFLHIVRDGRDVACSYREAMAKNSASPYAPKLKTRLSDIANEWFANVMRADSFMTKMPSRRAITIRYEDLVRDSSKTIEQICDWLGLQFESEMLYFHLINESKKLEPESTMAWKERTIKPISDETVGRYRLLLTNYELINFGEIAKKALSRFNYQ
jgi:hypothetical protein